MIILLVGAYYGVDLSGLVGNDFSPQVTQQTNSQEEQQLAGLSKVVLADTEKVWGAYFKQMGSTYQEPTMVLYNGQYTDRLRDRAICDGAILLSERSQGLS